MPVSRTTVPLSPRAIPAIAGAAIVQRAAGPWWQTLARQVADSFAIDLRSLAVFRLGLGLLVLADAVVALSNAEMFLSDAGFLQRTLLYERQWPSPLSWSFHALSGSVEVQVTLLVLQMLTALWMIAGWRTRLATLCCWLLVCSLETRNPVIMNGADALTRLLLFWGMFLPLGARWSLDAWRRSGQTAATGSSVRSVAGAALLLQVAFVYWFSVICKTHECWWGDGSALVQTLQLDLFARPAGVWLREHGALCRWLTYGWLIVEAAGPLLAFVPFWRDRLRVAVVMLFVAFHLGIELTMNIGAFPFVMMVAWCVFLPGIVWEGAGRKLQVSGSKLIGKISGAISASLRLSRSARLQGRFNLERSTSESKGWTQNSGIDPLSFLQSWSLKLEPSHTRLLWFASRASTAFCLACLAFVFMWNVRGTNFAYWERYFPRSVNPVAFALRLDQHWSMFAPRPSTEDGWFVLRAGMSDGSEVDLLRNGAVADFRKPPLVSGSFKDARWQKLLTNVWLEEYRHLREPLGDAVARQWNATHGGLSQVVAWQLWFMLEPTLPDGTAGPPGPCLLFERERFGSGMTSAHAHELRAGSL